MTFVLTARPFDFNSQGTAEGLLGLRALIALIFAAVLAWPAAIFAEDQAAVTAELSGIWATGGSLLEVKPEGDTLSMRIIAIERPNGPDGKPLLDTKNPDKSLRGEPLLGLELLGNYKFKKGRWQGKIYDPETGSVYSSRMKFADGRLEMRGYIGTPLLGKTKKFRPVTECRDDIIVMLNNSNITGYCGIEQPDEVPVAPVAPVAVESNEL